MLKKLFKKVFLPVLSEGDATTDEEALVFTDCMRVAMCSTLCTDSLSYFCLSSPNPFAGKLDVNVLLNSDLGITLLAEAFSIVCTLCWN